LDYLLTACPVDGPARVDGIWNRHDPGSVLLV